MDCSGGIPGSGQILFPNKLKLMKSARVSARRHHYVYNQPIRCEYRKVSNFKCGDLIGQHATKGATAWTKCNMRQNNEACGISFEKWRTPRFDWLQIGDCDPEYMTCKTYLQSAHDKIVFGFGFVFWVWVYAVFSIGSVTICFFSASQSVLNCSTNAFSK